MLYCVHVVLALSLGFFYLGGAQSEQKSEIEDIRLINEDLLSHMGRVEVMYNGTWGTICDNFWSYNDAKVACNMLGYEDAVCAVSRAQFGSAGENTSILMDNVQCRGQEAALDLCDFNGWGNYRCDHNEDAGVICQNSSLIATISDIRVIESTTKSVVIGWTVPKIPEGVVDYRYYITLESERNFFPLRRYVFPRFGIANTTGDEAKYTINFLQRDTKYSLQMRLEVRYSFCFSYMEGNFSDIQYFKTNDTIKQSDIKLRLIPPQSNLDFMGRLEVFHENKWGTVCDDLFFTTEANVVCGMLNYTDGALCVVRSAGFGRGEGTIWLDNVDCRSEHEVLDDCSFNDWGQTNCNHGDDVGVICRKSDFLDPVENLTISHVASTSISVKWNPYTFPTGTFRNQFLLQYVTPRFGFLLPRSIVVPADASEYTLNRLLFGRQYNISIRARVSFSQCRFNYLVGDESEIVSAVTQETPPSGPPTSFHVVVLNSTAIEVQWDMPLISLRNGIIRGYKIFYKNTMNDKELFINIPDNATLSYIIGDLMPSTTYTFSILAYTVGDGPRSIHLTTITNPEGFDPIIVRFGINGNGLDKETRFTFQTDLHVHCSPSNPDISTVNWFFSNGTQIGYSDRNIREGFFPNGTASLQIASNRRLSYCDAGVYTCKVNTSSGLMQSKNFTLKINTLPPFPSRPTKVKVTSNSIRIAWDEAECDGGHTLLSFTIQYIESGSNPFFPFFGTVSYIRGIDPTLRVYTINDLDPETSYNIRIQANSVEGRSSSYSPGVNILTLPPAPTSPRNVKVRLVTPSLVQVSWRLPAVTNGHIVRFTVYAIPVLSPRVTMNQSIPETISTVFAGTRRSGNVTLEHHSITYQFRVSASILYGDDTNEGELSLITSNSTLFVPEVDLPVPDNVYATEVRNTSITLVWDYPSPPFEAIESFLITYVGQVEWISPKQTLIRFEDTGEIIVSAPGAKLSPLIPGTLYQFKVSAITQRGRGAEVTHSVRTEAAESPQKRLAYFQIRIQPIMSCIEFKNLTGNSMDKLKNVRYAVIDELKHICQGCGITKESIDGDEFSCRSGLTKQIVYRARILGTSVYSAPDITLLIQSWVSTGSASIQFGTSRLDLDPTCPTSLDTFKSQDCPIISTAEPPIITTPELEGRPGKSRSGVVTVGEAVGITVGLGIFILLIVLIVLLVVKKWKPKVSMRNGQEHKQIQEDKTPFAEIESNRASFVDADSGDFDKSITGL